MLSGFLLGSFAASFAGLCPPSGLVELLDRRLGRSTAGHIRETHYVSDAVALVQKTKWKD